MPTRKTVNLDKEENNEKVKIEEMPEEVVEEVRFQSFEESPEGSSVKSVWF